MALLDREFRFKTLDSAEERIRSMSLTGKIIFWALVIIFAGSVVSMLWRINRSFLVSVPSRGGTFTEGAIGLPRFINPVLAVTDSDKDLTSLVYSGLMRYTNDGSVFPDLADNYSVSSDGRVYTFTLKSGLTFQDGTPITSDDVIFTISKIQNPALKSGEFANWQGVVVQKVDDRQFKFILRQAYAPFIENTTVGILPKHIWANLGDDAFLASPLNMHPTGSGPYTVLSVKTNAAGLPSQYTLKPFMNHVAGAPLIDKVVFSFFENEKDMLDAYTAGKIDSMSGISPETASSLTEKGASVLQAPLPRVFGVFFNQTENSALADKAVRQALNESVNRPYIVNTVLRGYATVLTDPVPQAFVDNSTKPSGGYVDSIGYDSALADASALLDKNGWIPGPDGIRQKKTKTATTTLTFSISTPDAPELKQVADILKEEWRKIGADVTVKVFEGGYLNQNIIRPRHYEGLLFGEIVNRDLDLYAFWHSSQSDDPGLNVALYKNPTVDKALEDMRSSGDQSVRRADYQKIQTALSADVPAVFLYSPNFIYVSPHQVKNVSVGLISAPSDRFGNIVEWYIDTDNIWKIFTKNK